jgi:beta-phosphoglucomutase-like phosphatase (HAD superfamily)
MNTRAKLAAIIFGCDGVLIDSERDGHRVALNKAISEVRKSKGSPMHVPMEGK